MSTGSMACHLCGSVKFFPRVGAHQLCGKCDRLHCSMCKATWLRGDETRCPGCHREIIPLDQMT